MEQARTTRARATVLVVLIAVATIAAVLGILGRNSASGTSNPPGSPFSGGGSPVQGSPFEGSGTPVGMVEVMSYTRGKSWSRQDAAASDPVAFTAQATPATTQQLAQLGLAASGCSGTYWTWRGHFERREATVLWYEFGPVNYWCGTARGNVSQSGWGWVNQLGAYGGVYAFKGGDRTHTPFGFPSVHVLDRWHYHLTKADDDRWPSVDYDLFANGRVSGTVYKG